VSFCFGVNDEVEADKALVAEGTARDDSDDIEGADDMDESSAGGKQKRE
jgi:hypothetical protein